MFEEMMETNKVETVYQKIISFVEIKAEAPMPETSDPQRIPQQ